MARKITRSSVRHFTVKETRRGWMVHVNHEIWKALFDSDPVVHAGLQQPWDYSDGAAAAGQYLFPNATYDVR